jgi:hypothetical protein
LRLKKIYINKLFFCGEEDLIDAFYSKNLYLEILHQKNLHPEILHLKKIMHRNFTFEKIIYINFEHEKIMHGSLAFEKFPEKNLIWQNLYPKILHLKKFIPENLELEKFFIHKMTFQNYDNLWDQHGKNVDFIRAATVEGCVMREFMRQAGIVQPEQYSSEYEVYFYLFRFYKNLHFSRNFALYLDFFWNFTTFSHYK